MRLMYADLGMEHKAAFDQYSSTILFDAQNHRRIVEARGRMYAFLVELPLLIHELVHWFQWRRWGRRDPIAFDAQRGQYERCAYAVQFAVTRVLFFWKLGDVLREQEEFKRSGYYRNVVGGVSSVAQRQ